MHKEDISLCMDYGQTKKTKYFFKKFEMKNVDDFMLWIKRITTQLFAIWLVIFVVNHDYCYNTFYGN